MQLPDNHVLLSRVSTAVPYIINSILAGVLIVVLLHVYQFSQQRFFTIDEYQYSHAAWLTAQGQLPYRDYFEHHFPLMNLVLAPLTMIPGTFASKALILRFAIFSALVVTVTLIAYAVWRRTRQLSAALLASILLLSFGFSAMSAIDIRADNAGAFALISAFALMDLNRLKKQKKLAILSGVLIAMAILFTQKMALYALITLPAIWLFEKYRRSRKSSQPLLYNLPLTAGTTIIIGFVFIIALAALGIFDDFWQRTIMEAIKHEKVYGYVSVWEYLQPFLAVTLWSSLSVILLAGVFMVYYRDTILLPATVTAVLVGVLVIKAQYPYNYVYVLLLLIPGAVLGWDKLMKYLLRLRFPGPAVNIMYLLPLLVIPQQIDFTADVTSNQHQLAAFNKIERYTQYTDAIIDNAGGAMFRPSATYYFMHGDAHRRMFEEYFSSKLIDDYRASRAPIRIDDIRVPGLPEKTQLFLQTNYIQADGSLHALGLVIPPAPAGQAKTVDIIRAGTYYLNGLGDVKMAAISIDGLIVDGDTIFLDEGPHTIFNPENNPPLRISIMPPSFFIDQVTDGKPHTMLFEYGKQRP